MATAALRRAMTAFTRPPHPSDADLLRQFASSRSEAAFAALVRRHGPLVLGVCRRVVPDAHLADDAFQAAFVVLARRAAGLDSSRPLGPWLYGVAHRVALRARTMLGKRRKRETLTAAVPEVARHSPEVDDTATILDEEIAKLPDATRDAVILCELQGLSRKDAAARLGIAEGTLSSRLASARKTLAAKLQARGVVLSAALASAVVSPDLASAAVSAGTGVSLTSVVVSLADGASAMTLLNKLKLTAVAMLFLLLSAGGVGPWWANETSAAPVPKVKQDAGMIWTHDLKANELVAYSPELKELERVTLPKDERFLGLTPDGASVVYADKLDGGTYHLRPLDGDGKAVDLGLNVSKKDNRPHWNRDGTKFVRARILDLPDRQSTPIRYDLFDLKTKKATHLDKNFDGHWMLGWADDEHLLSRVMEGDEYGSVCRTSLDGKQTVLFKDDKFSASRLAVSRDGATLVVGSKITRRTKAWHHAPWMMDPETGKLRELLHAEPQDVIELVGSPDGQRLGFTWAYSKDPNNPERGWDELRLTVADPDGKNRQTVTLRNQAKGEDPHGVAVLGWYPTPKKNAPVPKAKAVAGLIWTHTVSTNTLTAYTPDGKEAKAVTLPEASRVFRGFTPDGTRMAFVGKGDNGLSLHLGPIDDSGAGTDTGLGCDGGTDSFVFSPDGQQVVRVRAEPVGKRPAGAYHSHTLYDFASKKETQIDLPADHQIVQWSADGQTWGLMHHNFADPKLPNFRWRTTLAGPKPDPKSVCDTHSFTWAETTADGRGWLAAGWKHTGDGKTPVFGLHAVADGKATELVSLKGVNSATVRRSPDGRRIVSANFEWNADTMKPGDTVFVLFNADGKNETKLFTLKDDFQATHLVGWFPTPALPADPKAKPPAVEKLTADADERVRDEAKRYAGLLAKEKK